MPDNPSKITHQKPPLGWHSRGYHPHLDSPEAVQSVGFRLADSVPAALLRRWRAERDEPIDGKDPSAVPNKLHAARLARLVRRFEDAGHGACHLRRPEIAALVQSALLYGDGDRYRLIEWCVMPNHVHVLIEALGRSLPTIVQGWKSVTARGANRLLRRSGQFWMRDYYDRYIRDPRHLHAARRYIWLNPVTAGLCREPAEWPWSSARLRNQEEVRALTEASDWVRRP